MAMVIGEPDADAAAVPPTTPVTKAAGASTSAATANLNRCLPTRSCIVRPFVVEAHWSRAAVLPQPARSMSRNRSPIPNCVMRI